VNTNCMRVKLIKFIRWRFRSEFSEIRVKCIVVLKTFDKKCSWVVLFNSLEAKFVCRCWLVNLRIHFGLRWSLNEWWPSYNWVCNNGFSHPLHLSPGQFLFELKSRLSLDKLSELSDLVSHIQTWNYWPW